MHVYAGDQGATGRRLGVDATPAGRNERFPGLLSGEVEGAEGGVCSEFIGGWGESYGIAGWSGLEAKVQCHCEEDDEDC